MVSLIILLVIVGVVLYLINTVVPMDGNIKTIINVVVLLCVILYVLQLFGLLDSLNTISPGRIR